MQRKDRVLLNDCIRFKIECRDVDLLGQVISILEQNFKRLHSSPILENLPEGSGFHVFLDAKMLNGGGLNDSDRSVNGANTFTRFRVL